MLPLNQKAPDFTLPSTSGENFKLSDFIGEAIVLYFYPKDNTRVCTAEACHFRDNFDLLHKVDIKVVGISTDSITKHLKFKSRHNLPFELLADTDGKVSKLYKAHIPFLNLSKRITYLLNTQHEVVAAVNDLFNSEIHLKKILDQLDKVKE
ncbi:MAG: peroxiredoxin [Fulvivirga sp.]